MRINSLKVTNFRNFENLEVQFSDGVNILYGDNGSGKTNLLEAIFLLCLGRSHKAASESLMVRHGEDVFRVEAEIETDDRTYHPAVAYQKKGRKKITLDQVPIKTSELFRTFCAVTAGPEDSEIISGSPSARREFINIYLSQMSGNYLTTLTDYHRVLTQKNAALRNEMDPTPFNALLIEFGVKIIQARHEFLTVLSSKAADIYRVISSTGLLECEYRPSVGSVDLTDTEQLAADFEMRLFEVFERERLQRTAVVGPHRDELYFSIGGFAARPYGSQGEWRSVALALKLAVNQLLSERGQTKPLLLLDEIFAELDEKRTLGLIESFAGFGQLFLTTAVEPPDALRNKSSNYRVSDDGIQKES